MNIDPTALLIWLLVGAIAGWLAGQVMGGGGFGLVGDLLSVSSALSSPVNCSRDWGSPWGAVSLAQLSQLPSAHVYYCSSCDWYVDYLHSGPVALFNEARCLGRLTKMAATISV